MPTPQQIVHNATTKTVKVQMPGDAPGSGFVDLGDYNHPNPTDPLGYDGNHVIWHHIRDALYKATPPVLDMQRLTIEMKHVTAIDVSPATTTKAAAATQQLTTTFTPADAANRYLTYESSDPTKATVSATGLITAVATGTATITVRSVDGGFTDTCVVTVS